jgi:alkyl sulfatase BDS1-like metallo-beta-lactamase superfamily hydrolase
MDISRLDDAADTLAKEVALRGAALSDRIAWSARITAEYTTVTNDAASDVLAAVHRTEHQTTDFLAAAEELREECPLLFELSDAVKRLLASVAHLEAQVDKLL